MRRTRSPWKRFSTEEISFPSIAAVVEETLERVPAREAASIKEVLEIDELSRSVARRLFTRQNKTVTRSADTCPLELRQNAIIGSSKYLVGTGLDRGHDSDPRIGPLLGGAIFSTSRWKLSVSVSARGCSDSRRARPISASRRIFFGGYVKMAGEQPGDEKRNDPRGFLAASLAGSV